MVKEKIISNLLKQVQLMKNKPYMDKLILSNLIFLGNEYGHSEVCDIIKSTDLIETKFRDILEYEEISCLAKITIKH